MKKLLTLLSFLALTSVTYGQIEIGVRGGLTLAGGYTDLPAVTRVSNGVNLDIPLVNNKGNGMGAGFIAGIYAKKEMASGLFLQADLNYASFTLKQKATDVSLDYNTSQEVNGAQIAVNGNIALPTTESESVLGGMNLNLLVGKNIADGKFRFYAGPNFLFVGKAEQTINYTGTKASMNDFTINGFTGEQLIGAGAMTAEQVAGTGLLVGSVLLPGLEANFAEPVIYDLTESTPAPDKKVNSMIISLDLGVGTTIPNTGLGVDLRYSVPVFTGVYENEDIEGFLGITSLTLSYAILKPKAEKAVAE